MSRTIIRGNLSKMISILDKAEGIAWSVQFDDSNPRYYNLRSVDGNGNPMVQLWIQRDPFRITATRTIKTPRKLKMHLRDDEDSHLPISTPAESGQAVIWKTKKRPLQYQVRDTEQEPSAIVLSVEKPDPARYMGFGEQGGKDLFKDNTYMNYFSTHTHSHKLIPVRYAGLWTGDNASTWDFLQISVAQVIALGLAGVTIAGADVGGFEPPEGNLTAFTDPELLIRWYCAYSLLPWFRNHYTAKHTDKENVDWKKKDFQQKQARREIYFPSTTAWFPMNLRPHYDDAIGEALQPSVPGGSNVSFDCHIAPEDGHLPHVCPMYIREGAIIPQIQHVVEDADGDRVTGRRITLSTGWKGVGEGVRRGDDALPDAERYDDEQVERDVGAEYRLVVWHEPQTDMAGVAVNVLRGGGGIRVGEDDVGKKASVVWVPTRKDVEAVIEVVYQ
ncbi:hypothetical protein SLS55_007636 [Diplodia seriata]|uniref:alpha-glucosidase n=1 Tax=Diplodia seriata TaxID=420778 RepID=A0ABR3C860_9PEZI